MLIVIPKRLSSRNTKIGGKINFSSNIQVGISCVREDHFLCSVWIQFFGPIENTPAAHSNVIVLKKIDTFQFNLITSQFGIFDKDRPKQYDFCLVQREVLTYLLTSKLEPCVIVKKMVDISTELIAFLVTSSVIRYFPVREIIVIQTSNTNTVKKNTVIQTSGFLPLLPISSAKNGKSGYYSSLLFRIYFYHESSGNNYLSAISDHNIPERQNYFHFFSGEPKWDKVW